MAYDGFISYSHAADDRLAPALQWGLQRLAKPWNHRRALRVFRDETGLSTNPHLWSAIEGALDESAWFVLLASPDAATSEWVNKEIAHWLATKSIDRMLPVVTDGTWEWDPSIGDFTAGSSAVPYSLRGALVAEPRHLDVRWAHDETDLDLRNSRFRSAVADLAAPMHGVAKDELEGEDIRQHRRARRLARVGVSALAVLVVIAGVFGVFALTQRDRANRQSRLATLQARLADARRLAMTAVSGARDDPSRSALLAIEANRLVNNAETRGALLNLVEDTAPVREIIHGTWNAAAVTVDGRMVATVSAQGVSLVDLATRRARLISRQNFHDVGSATFSHDGSLLALGSQDIAILNARTGALVRRLPFPIHESTELSIITNVRFSPDSRSIAAISYFGDGVVWSVASGAELAHFFAFVSGDGLEDVAFSPDGRWLSATGIGGLVFAAPSPQAPSTSAALEPRNVPPHPADVTEYDIAFSPDGTRFATSGVGFAQTNDGVIVVRDSATGAEIASISTGSVSLARLAFSPDGRTIAGARTDGSVSEWDARTGAVVGDGLLGPTRAPLSLSFSPNGALVVLTTAEIVVLDPAARLAVKMAAPNNAAAISSLAVSPDRRSLAAADGLGHVRVWDIASGRLRRMITVTSALGEGALAGAYQPGTSTIVVGAGDGTVAAWDSRSGRRIHAPIRLTPPNVNANIIPGRGVFGLAFDASGRTLVAATGDGRVVVIDSTSWTVRKTLRLVNDTITWSNTVVISADGKTVALAAPHVVAFSDLNGRHRRSLDTGPFVATSIALTADGRLVATGLDDGLVLLADFRTGDLRTTLVSNHGAVGSLTFDRSGTTLAIGGRDGTLTLWSVAQRQPLGPRLSSSQLRTILTLAFSPNSTTLFAASADGSLVRYELQSSLWIEQLCAVTGRNLTPDERRAYLGDRRAGRQTCPNWPAEP